MRWKIATAVLAFLLVVTNGLQLYGSISCAVTLSYREELLYEFANVAKTSTRLAELLMQGKPQAEMMDLLKQVSPRDQLYVQDGTVNTTWVHVTLDSSGLARHLVLEDLVSQWARPPNQRE